MPRKKQNLNIDELIELIENDTKEVPFDFFASIVYALKDLSQDVASMKEDLDKLYNEVRGYDS
jgi:hypothetical protein